MSIASEISRIQQAKADLKTAIEAKGVTVPSSATIDTYDDYVSQITGGGGGYLTREVVVGVTCYGQIPWTISAQTQISVDSGSTWVNSGDTHLYNGNREIRTTSGVTYCFGNDLVCNTQQQVSINSGITWYDCCDPQRVVVESGASQCQSELEYIPFDTRMEQYGGKYIKRIVIGDSFTYNGAAFSMGNSNSYLTFRSDGSVTAYGDFIVDGVTNLQLPIDITPINPVQLDAATDMSTYNAWGKTTVISFWPYAAEIYNGFSDLHIEWQE